MTATQLRNNYLSSTCSPQRQPTTEYRVRGLLNTHLTPQYSLEKLETTPLRVVVSYAYLVFSQPPACLHQAM